MALHLPVLWIFLRGFFATGLVTGLVDRRGVFVIGIRFISQNDFNLDLEKQRHDTNHPY
jgi:hypothetical protein